MLTVISLHREYKKIEVLVNQKIFHQTSLDKGDSSVGCRDNISSTNGARNLAANIAASISVSAYNTASL